MEIVIGNMCLRQTKQKKVRLMKVVPARVHTLSFYLCHSVKYQLHHPPHQNYRMLSTLMQIQFNWLFVYMLHSAAHGRSLTSASKKQTKRLPVVFSFKVPRSTHQFSFDFCFVRHSGGPALSPRLPQSPRQQPL